MTRLEDEGRPRCSFLAVLLCALLGAASGALAQAPEILYSMSPNDAWPKGTRADGKLTALSFAFGAQVAGTGARAQPSAAQDTLLLIPVGEPVALWFRAAMTGRFLNTVLVEFPFAGEKAQTRAPFAVRFTEVFVTSVQVSKSSGAAPGVVEVKFKARKFEIFTATQDATGAMKPGYPFNWDYAKQSSF